MAKKRPNKKERIHLARIAQMNCFCCNSPAEVHHIRKNTGLSLKPSHYHTIPLCFRHHRTGKDSIHLGKKLFIKLYGTEQEILKIVTERLDESKEYYRDFHDE